MAKQASLFKYRGRYNDTVGVFRHGDYHLRSIPLNVNQSIRTKASAKRFGAASSMGALIRRAFVPSLYDGFDKRYINQLTSTLYTGKALKGFRFNQDKGIERFFSKMPFHSRDGLLHIPAHGGLSITVIAARINFETKEITGRVVLTGIDLLLPVDVGGEGTLIITMQVSDGWHVAADIIAVEEPVIFKDMPEYTGMKIPRLINSAHFTPAVNQRE